jgi:hypothetical protein
MQQQPRQQDLGIDLQELIIEELKFLLAEIRTSMAGLRTGLMLFILPLLSVSTIIITSKHHNLMSVIRHPIAILLCSAMVLAGGCLVIKAFFQIRSYHRQIAKIEEKFGAMPDLPDEEDD